MSITLKIALLVTRELVNDRRNGKIRKAQLDSSPHHSTLLHTPVLWLYIHFHNFRPCLSWVWKEKKSKLLNFLILQCKNLFIFWQVRVKNISGSYYHLILFDKTKKSYEYLSSLKLFSLCLNDGLERSCSVCQCVEDYYSIIKE